MKDIHDKIRAIRILKNYSQEHMAESLGISQSSYGKMERGTTKVSWEKLQRLSEILNMTIWEIAYFNEKEPPAGLSEDNVPMKNGTHNDSEQRVEMLNERIRNLEQVNQLLEKQLKDKSEIIRLLKKETAN